MIVAELERVTKRFGAVAALDDVSFSLKQGEIAALLGPNGAGKSTAIALLLGLRRPSSGRVRLFAADPRRPPSRKTVGAAPQETSFPPTLRVGELVELVRAHYERPLPFESVVERFGLERLVARQVGGLSGGERRRVGVALAFAGAPRLVVLDEPTTGLDVEARAAVWGAVRAHAAAGGSTLLTTHHLDEAEALAGRVILIERGTIVADGSLAEIKAGAGLAVVRFRGRAAAVDGAQQEGSFVRIVTPEPGTVVERLVQTGHQLADLEVRPVSLEEALASRSVAR
ncbi:MAG TPA: ABC transporter ATP-binding protein [Gaiellaceae bacterium]